MEDLKQKAIDLLEPFYNKHNVDVLNYITQDGYSIDGDYCSDCIDNAIMTERLKFIDNIGKINNEFDTLLKTRIYHGKVIDDKYTDEDIQKEKERKIYELGTDSFEKQIEHNVEIDYFPTCNICGKSLSVSILPNDFTLNDILDDLSDDEINEEIGYKAYLLIINSYSKGEKWYNEEEGKLTEKLINKVIKILNNKQ